MRHLGTSERHKQFLLHPRFRLFPRDHQPWFHEQCWNQGSWGVNTVDPCWPYSQHGHPCPVTVSTSLSATSGLPNSIPLGALFKAAGLDSLDVVGGATRGGSKGATIRLSGLILLINIDYTNYYLSQGVSIGTRNPDLHWTDWRLLFDDSHIQFTYNVTVGETTRLLFNPRFKLLPPSHTHRSS